MEIPLKNNRLRRLNLRFPLYRFGLTFAALIACLLWMNGCVWDEEAELRPQEPEPEPDECPTDSLRYAHVKPLIETHCVSCHADETAGGGILLRDYNETRAQAESGTLVGVVTRDPLFSAMPPTYALEDCQIDSIQAWVEAGAPQ